MRGRPITFKYKNFNYTLDIQKLISSTILTQKDNVHLEKVINNYKKSNIKRGYKYIIKDLYIFIKNGLTTKEISKIYDVSDRTIQIWLKELGINRTRKQSQKIAATKRDYKAIHESYKKTMYNKLLRENSSSINLKDFIFQSLNSTLKLCLKEADFIIGIDALGIIDSKDYIPIIVFKDAKHYKFILNFNNNNDINTINLLKEKQYLILNLDTSNSTKEKIDEYIKLIVEEIAKYIN